MLVAIDGSGTCIGGHLGGEGEDPPCSRKIRNTPLKNPQKFGNKNEEFYHPP